MRRSRELTNELVEKTIRDVARYTRASTARLDEDGRVLPGQGRVGEPREEKKESGE